MWDILEKDVHGLFDKHNTDEASHRRKLKAYKEPNLEFVYGPHFITPKDSFIKLDMD